MNDFTELELRSDSAEATLLGALAFHADAMAHVLAGVDPEDFYKPARGAIWKAARALAADRKPIDPTAIARWLTGRGEYNHAVERLIQVEMSAAASVDRATAYALTITDLARRRDLMRICQRATEHAATHPGNASDALAAARAEFATAAVETDTRTGTLTWTELVDEFETAHAPGGSRPGIPSPWWELDYLIGGLFGSRVYVFGGRPGSGKSTAALCISVHAAVESGKQVLIFSKEMPSLDVTGRILAAGAEVPLGEIAARKVTDESKQRIRDYTKRVGNVPIRVNARPCGLTAIKNEARAQHNRIGLDVLVVDYLQLVRTDSPGRTREQEVAQVSRELKALAMELDIVVILPAQLNRASTSRADPKPTMADLRDSGQIEQDADAVILLYRPLDEKGQATRGIQMIVDKNRHGPQGQVDLDWRGSYGVIL